MEEVTMSMKEIDRLKVISNISEGRINWREAAEQLGISNRQVGRLCASVRKKGNRGVIHGLRGQPSNHRLDGRILEKALGLVREKYTDFGPSFANEKLEEKHGIKISVFTLRRKMLEEGLWKSARKRKKHRSWRERKTCVGEMVQLDGSVHDWFEGRGPQCVLIIYIDDATSRILYGEFVNVEDSFTLLRTTRKYLLEHGRPGCFYVDKDSIYKVNRQATAEEELLGEEAITQFSRGMGELGIGMIFAHSPQAKGRVERGFRTHQDRLVKELRLAGISTKEAANRFLWTQYIPGHNKRYAVEPANPTDAHRPLLKTHSLDEILSVRYERTVANDYTVRYQNQYFQILADQVVRVRPKDKVSVEERLDRSTHLRFRKKELSFKALSQRPYKPYYSLRTRSTAVPVPSGPYLPPYSHPWKALSYQRMVLKKKQRELRRTGYARTA